MLIKIGLKKYKREEERQHSNAEDTHLLYRKNQKVIATRPGQCFGFVLFLLGGGSEVGFCSFLSKTQMVVQAGL